MTDTQTLDHLAPRRIAYVGNFGPPHSTENHVAETLRRMGVELRPYQENVPREWADLEVALQAGEHDLVLWTRTGWDPPIPHATQRQMLATATLCNVPTVGFHLDRWWGLARAGQVWEEPFFQCDLVATADGGHPDQWREAGVNHLWLPPAVAEWQCGWGEPDPRWACEVAFVGSWSSYHPEWGWRTQMVRQLQNRYGARRMRVWPQPGEHAVRGKALRDLYASATVVVGDSCLAPTMDGDPMHHYWSDRVPETMGRAGLLVHPWVDGMDDVDYEISCERWFHHDGESFLTYQVGEITDLFDVVDETLAMPVDQRMEIRRTALQVVLDRHTYRHRMQALLANVDVLVAGGVTA